LTKGHKATKVDLKRDVSALALSDTLRGLMAEKGDTLSKRDEKWRWEKEAAYANFIDLTKRAIEIEERNAHTKTIEVDAKLLVKENQIMLADLSIIEREQRACSRRSEPSSANKMRDHSLSISHERCALLHFDSVLLCVNYVIF
jgi:hypothetical protein